MSQGRLYKWIIALCSAAKDVCPEAEIFISTDNREHEDATLKIFVPESKVDKVEEKLYPMRVDILDDEGYDIVLWVDAKKEAAASSSFA